MQGASPAASLLQEAGGSRASSDLNHESQFLEMMIGVGGRREGSMPWILKFVCVGLLSSLMDDRCTNTALIENYIYRRRHRSSPSKITGVDAFIVVLLDLPILTLAPIPDTIW